MDRKVLVKVDMGLYECLYEKDEEKPGKIEYIECDQKEDLEEGIPLEEYCKHFKEDCIYDKNGKVIGVKFEPELP